jgi:DNA-binding transcriptional ArsR family regulator
MTYQAQVLAALADPTRRSILERLRRGPLPVGELAGSLPISRPAVSQHLKVLKAARLVEERQEGTRRFYRVDAAGLLELQRYLESFWGGVLESFAATARVEAAHHPRLKRRSSSAPKRRKPR